MRLNKDFYTKEIFGRVMEKFGQKDWTQDKARLVYEIVKPLTEKEFSLLVDELILDFSRSPSGKDIRLLVNKIFEKRNSQQKETISNQHKMKLSNQDQSRFFQLLLKTYDNPSEQNKSALNKAVDYLATIAPKTKCNKCLDTGTVIATKEKSEYAFKCFCSEGLKNQNAWTVWNSSPYFKIKHLQV